MKLEDGNGKYQGAINLALILGGAILLKNKNEDSYVKEDVQFSEDKKRNMEYWDVIDGEAQDFLEKLALMVGIEIKEWGDEDAIKEVVGTAIHLIEERFEVKFPFVDKNY